MKVVTLNQAIFRLVLGLVLVTALAILVNVYNSTLRLAQQQLKKELQVAEKVITQALGTREEQLVSSAYVLTADFGFKEAVATFESKTIASALENHGQRINADVMAILSLDGQMVSTFPTVFKSGHSFSNSNLIDEAIQNSGASGFLMIGDALYQVILLTVEAPVPIAVALVGFEVDKALLAEFRDITQLDTTIRVRQQESRVYEISTLANTEVINDGATLKFDWLDVLFAQSYPVVSRTLTLSDHMNQKIKLVLSQDLEELYSEFSVLQWNITIITLVALAIAMISAALLSRYVTRPIAVLARAARDTAKGRYNHKIERQSSTREVNLLSDAFSQMRKDIQTREAQIKHEAEHDPLTGLRNRPNIANFIDQNFRDDLSFQAIGINIAGFRNINDVFGYHHGDQCLKILAERVRSFGGLSARLTGGELLWLPSETLTKVQLQEAVLQLEQPVVCGVVTINLKVAIGVLQCPKDANSSEPLFKRMNIVLDEAQIKKQFLLFYSEQLEEKYTRRLSIVTELEKALTVNQHELSLAYQPKLDLKSMSVTGAEALIRWNSSVLGFVPPDDFIAIAEQGGLIGQLTNWVIARAAKDAREFSDKKVPVSIAINLSAKDVSNTQLLPFIFSQLKQYSLPNSAFSFEITESDLLRDPQRAIAQLDLFREEGFLLAIDDFGTGYSSLAYLKNLPVNTIKIDKSFVLNLAKQSDDQHIVKTILNLASTFMLTTVAEGIEDYATLEMLTEWGCDWAQGYYISRPVNRDDFISWYHENLHTAWLEKQ
ncbi:putative bifunctional diguanylate cyclase/phosphodiesterase [Alteromonas lipotrueiana]|uniref:putative bifunctional diguanylate cyclase/phosphodiesterase n=1 Tax=Alteromonas lipotrueiana TaxID=2803815 RepID=UPI001C4443FB